MGIGVGSSKQEFGYDLNAAAYSWRSAADTTGNWVRVAKKVYGIMFHFTTVQDKTVTVTLSVTSSGTVYPIFHTRKHLPKERNFILPIGLELPANVDLTIAVTKTAGACSMNFITVDK